MYWYHPHVHGLSEAALLGGASGALIVSGIQRLSPSVAGLPERVIIFRDSLVPNSPGAAEASCDSCSDAVPTWDLSLNYMPVPYPSYNTTVVAMRPGATELWRMLSAVTDSILSLQLVYDGVAQPLQVVATDGVVVGSARGTQQGRAATMSALPMQASARIELIMPAPPSTVKVAILYTLDIDTGPLGDVDPLRPLIRIVLLSNAPTPSVTIPAASPILAATPSYSPIDPLSLATPDVKRLLYFSEIVSDPNDPDSPTEFYITVDGATPVLFSARNPPAITAVQVGEPEGFALLDVLLCFASPVETPLRLVPLFFHSHPPLLSSPLALGNGRRLDNREPLRRGAHIPCPPDSLPRRASLYAGV